MWTPATRKDYIRTTARYQSDVTDEEWRVIEPHLPPAKLTGRPRAWPLREIVNGIFYVMRSGCAWRQMPTDLPPWSTVYRWFAAWRDACVFERINHILVMADRERVGREASPSAAVIDSQSVKEGVLAATMRGRVRLDGARHLWRKVPSRQLSIDLEADERCGRVTGRAEAS